MRRINIKKTIPWGLGFLSAETILYGIASLILPSAVSRTIGIVALCLNIATGMLAPNPISVVRFFENLCVIFIPGIVSAVILVLIGMVGAVVNFAVAKKKQSVTAVEN